MTLTPEYAEALEQLQITCFPTLAPAERMRAEHFLNHDRLFPEGNFVAVAIDSGRERVVGLGSGFLTDFDFAHPNHTFTEMISDGFYTRHDPAGVWYYGGDISVHPDYRCLGVGRLLYEARKDYVQRTRRRGIVAGGMLPGYDAHRHLSVPEYVERVVAGDLFDPTLTFQLKNGFEVRGLLENYLTDSASDNWATLIVWDNPKL